MIEESGPSVKAKNGTSGSQVRSKRKPGSSQKPKSIEKTKGSSQNSSDRMVALEFFIEGLLKKAKNLPSIEKLPLGDQTTATLLLTVLDDAGFHPDNLGNFKSLPEAIQSKLVKQSENFFFLSLVFFEMYKYPVGLSALRKVINHFEKAPEFLMLLEAQEKKPQYQGFLIEIAEHLTLNTDEFKLLRWTLLAKSDHSTLARYQQMTFWSIFRDKSEEFFELPATFRSLVIKKIEKRAVDLLTFLAILRVQKSSKNQLTFLMPRLEAMPIEDLLGVAINKPDLVTRDFLEILFRDSLQKKLISITNIEGCLPYFTLESLHPGLIGNDAISRAWKRSNHRTSGLILNFRSDEIGKLNQEIEILRSEYELQSSAFNEMTALANSRELEISKLSKILDSYESRLKARVQNEDASQGAVERQIYIDTYRKLAEVIEPELARSKSESLLLMLAKLGLTRIGHPGEPIEWDSTTCESLTGAEISNPTVIRAGYTWTSSGERAILIKALVKPAS